jgi:hypothetical protein
MPAHLIHSRLLIACEGLQRQAFSPQWGLCALRQFIPITVPALIAPRGTLAHHEGSGA